LNTTIYIYSLFYTYTEVESKIFSNLPKFLVLLNLVSNYKSVILRENQVAVISILNVTN